ncbi:uncharacterized protein LOC116847978 [Odontomachus brunneus]|uniref:uncharacterized protein LOC116847978 n=1 Tax=Odontomachus brunneus TaxID=486640 RepID=UPI0013F2A115|nr:uncharacterized protein LOC116847978 [Odontomachus brunneus]
MTDKKRYVIVEFKDGLQIVPITWLSTDSRRSKWPRNYISNDRYDRAVRSMEIPDSTWEEHDVLKIYTTCSDYTVARQKLKLAEHLSDINSCSDEENNIKKSRKIRAAKVHDSSSYDYSEDEDDSDQVILSNLPIPPTGKKIDNISKGISGKKITQAYKDPKNVKKVDTTYTEHITSCSSYNQRSCIDKDNFCPENAKKTDTTTTESVASCSSYNQRSCIDKDNFCK